jgi:hypothetical protein
LKTQKKKDKSHHFLENVNDFRKIVNLSSKTAVNHIRKRQEKTHKVRGARQRGSAALGFSIFTMNMGALACG